MYINDFGTSDQTSCPHASETAGVLSCDEEDVSFGDETASVPDSQDDDHSAIRQTSSSNTDSFLICVPAEIRMGIYKNIMPSCVKIISCFSYDKGLTGPVRFWVPDEEHIPSSLFHELPHFNVLQTCRQINNEMQLLPYQSTLFDLGDIRDAMMFFSTLSFDKLANIRRLRIECKLGSMHYTGRMDWGYHHDWMTFCKFAMWALSDLRELHIHLIGWGYEERIVTTGYSLDDYVILQEILDLDNAWVRSLVQLRYHTLSKVVIVPDNRGHINTDRGVEELRVDFAKTITRKLLRQEEA